MRGRGTIRRLHAPIVRRAARRINPQLSQTGVCSAGLSVGSRRADAGSFGPHFGAPPSSSRTCRGSASLLAVPTRSCGGYGGRIEASRGEPSRVCNWFPTEPPHDPGRAARLPATARDAVTAPGVALRQRAARDGRLCTRQSRRGTRNVASRYGQAPSGRSRSHEWVLEPHMRCLCNEHWSCIQMMTDVLVCSLSYNIVP